MIKADAYGHGAAVLAAASENLVDGFAVAEIGEAAELVAAGITKPIHILASSEPATAQISARANNIVPSVCDLREIRILKQYASGIIKNVNLKINTGMNRLGVAPDEVVKAATQIRRAGFKINGVFSHLYNAADEYSANRQLRIFQSCTAFLSKDIKRHIAASSCMGLSKNFYLDAVRPGLALYSSVLKVRAPILKIFRVKKGGHISYGDYSAPRDMLIAAIRAGYADGVRRKPFPNQEDRFVSVNGVLCPIVGQVCMDILLADVTKAQISYAACAYVLGEGITAQMLADACGTNVYEILTSFKGRIERKYI